MMKTSDELKAMAEATPGRDGYFAAMYYQVTKSIEEDIKEFSDPDAMEEFVRVFSQYYIKAYYGATHSKCWRAAFQEEDEDEHLILQHLLLGINAHINYDLPQAVNEFSTTAGLDHLSYGDYYYINFKLEQGYERIIQNLDLASRWANEAAALGGRRMFNFSLVKAREVAWNSAELLAASRNSNERSDFLDTLDDWVSGLAYLIVHPPRFVRPVIDVLGLMEDKDPATVTGKLLRSKDY